MNPWERPGIDALVKESLHGNVVFIAPTGYGKSKSVPKLLEEASRQGVATRVMHILPLRALVEQQYRFLKELLGEAAGYLAGLRLEEKGYSGFMLRRAVVSTLDSFALNIARLPVVELAGVLEGVLEGHYELPRAAIASSLVVLDETHLYAEPWASEGPLSRWFLSVVLQVLAGANIPVVVETATMSERLVNDIARVMGAKIVVVCRECCRPDWRCVIDRGYEEKHNIAWRTSIAPNRDEAVKRAVEYALEGRRVLVVANTVTSALSIYESIIERLGRKNVVLVHGRLSHRDREEAIERISSAKLIVATQVVEAGVDVDAEILVTEAAAPSSLAQRAGRLCRSNRTLERCRTEPPEIILYMPEKTYPYPKNVVASTLGTICGIVKKGGIEWRLLDTHRLNGKTLTSFRVLVEKYESESLVMLKSHEAAAYREILRHTIKGVFEGSKLSKVLFSKYCSLVRNATLVELAVPLEDNGREDYDTLEISLDLLTWLERNGRRVLDCDRNKCKAVLVGYSDELVKVPVELPRSRVAKALSDCRSYTELYPVLLREASQQAGVRGFQLLFVTAPGAYVKGLGLMGV
ncbi:CRISPR-associated helicase Cas3 [Pyrodictium delaneyi]|uniref:CRISPR-associated helicase Cas3 n=1 Tax=Pyrodictium delaneyi TaxID=1273541 RepID=A0A0P0N1T2_9CREN|nr:CRISPR-associated helicase Cas3' [Pyrodictium delaneyi]ALL00354.1 CRISPR-associated helicase Cas3 [Pyrodictium delaneyi]OWJ54410.1 CRISPR-associated helicase Cas3' [Pyrodictium delaneyi]